MKYGVFEKKLGTELLKWFNEKGYKIESDQVWRFIKETDSYVNYVSIIKGNEWRPKMNCIALSCARKLNILESLIQEFKFPRQDGLGHTFVIQPMGKNIFTETRKCFAPELENDVELALEHVVDVTEKRFIPELDRLSDIKILNALENKTVEHNGLVAADDMWLRKLALAWAAQDPIYEDIYKYVNDMDEKLIAANDEHQALYINYSIAFKQLYIKLNSLPKFENTLLI